MMRKKDVLEFVNELCESTGLHVYLGLNAFITQTSIPFDLKGESYRVKIDPAAFTFEEKDKIKDFAQRKGLVIEDYWNDWGRYLKIWKSSERS